MKYALVLLLLAGCASAPPPPVYVPPPPPPPPVMPAQTLVVEETVHAMSRLEVVNAINECQAGKTRAVVIYGKRKVGGVTRDIVVDVSCAPLY